MGIRPKRDALLRRISAIPQGRRTSALRIISKGVSAESVGFIAGAVPALVITEEAERRASQGVRSNWNRPKRTDSIRARYVSPRRQRTAPASNGRPQTNPDNDQTQFFLGVSYIYAKDKEGTLKQNHDASEDG